LTNALQVANELKGRGRLFVSQGEEEGVRVGSDDVGSEKEARPAGLEGPGLGGCDQPPADPLATLTLGHSDGDDFGRLFREEVVRHAKMRIAK
jgi:hypothetical protein